MKEESFQTLARKVYLQLRDEIAHGEIPPGTRLVRRALSKRLGVSPIPVTEALFRLEQDGLVESQPMYGARVKVWTLDAIRSDEVLREALECQTARLCAEKASDKDLRDLEEEAQALDHRVHENGRESREGMQAHFDFHIHIARLTGFMSLVEEVEKIWFRMSMLVSWINAITFKVPPDWHAQLIAAIASRDPDQAEQAMRRHTRHGIEHDQELLQMLSHQSPLGKSGGIESGSDS